MVNDRPSVLILVYERPSLCATSATKLKGSSTGKRPSFALAHCAMVDFSVLINHCSDKADIIDKVNEVNEESVVVNIATFSEAYG